MVAQYANHIHVWGEAPHESRRVWNKPLHCKVPDPLLREGVARETKLNGGLEACNIPPSGVLPEGEGYQTATRKEVYIIDSL